MKRLHYSGTATILVWVGAVAFGITFWMGVACLVSRIMA